MNEHGNFRITPEDISRAREITGIYPLSETPTPAATVDFDALVEQLFNEQPELSIYLTFKLQQLMDQRVSKNIYDAFNSQNAEKNVSAEPNDQGKTSDISPLRNDPYVFGAVFAYFSIPEEIRQKRLTFTQAIPLERIAEEADVAGRSAGEAEGKVVYQYVSASRDFSAELGNLAHAYSNPQDGWEFLAGSLLTLTPFISREESQALERLWGIPTEE